MKQLTDEKKNCFQFLLEVTLENKLFSQSFEIATAHHEGEIATVSDTATLGLQNVYIDSLLVLILNILN